MATANLIRFSRRCNVRGLTFLPQQFAGALPHGVYRYLGDELVNWSDLGKPRRDLMARLERVGHDEIWFVGPQVAQAALEATAKANAADRAYMEACQRNT